MECKRHLHTLVLELLAGSAAAGEQVVGQQAEPLPQVVGLRHGLGVRQQLGVQLLQVQQRLLLHLSQQMQGLLRHLVTRKGKQTYISHRRPI